MDSTKIVRGDDLMLFKWKRSAADPEGSEQNKCESLAFSTSHTLTLTSDFAEISCKDTGRWKTGVVNKLGWEITSDNLFSCAGYNELFNIWVSGEPINIVFGTKGPSEKIQNGIDSPTESWVPDEKVGQGVGLGKPTLYEGKAVITNLTVNAASGDNATYSITLQGVDAFTQCTGAPTDPNEATV